MRKVSIIILAIIFYSVIIVLAECPPPFQKAKEMALRASVNSHGNYLIRMDIKRDGENITYIIGFIPKMAQIGIGIEKNGELNVYVYNEYLKTFSKITYQQEVPMDAAECIAEANKIFRAMIIEQLL